MRTYTINQFDLNIINQDILLLLCKDISFGYDFNLEPYLSQEENERAKRFLFETDRLTYTLVHGMLNRVLAKITDRYPNSLSFQYTTQGKPVIDESIFFNLSHSKSCWALAISKFCEVGVDIEITRPLANYRNLIEAYFSENEQRKLVAESQPLREFYAIWTRKEAVLKCNGQGITTNLKNCDVIQEYVILPSNECFYLVTLKKNNFILSVASLKQCNIYTLNIDQNNYFNI